MQLKKKIVSLTAMLLSAALLSACTNTSQKVVFSDYWTADANVPAYADSVTESLEYDVSYEASSGLGAYTLHYANGKYVTDLTTEKYTDENGERYIYVYETNLTIDVTYQLGSETKEFKDKVYSLVKFEKAANSLRPISSHKEIVCASPNNTSGAKTLSDCYTEYDCVVDTTYNAALDNGNSKIEYYKTTEEGRELNGNSDHSFEIDTSKINYLDNEQLLFALRGINPSSSTSPSFLVYAPFVNKVQEIKTSFSTKTGEEFSFTKNGTAVKSTINYYPVSLSINDKNPGSTQTAWIAQKTELSESTNNVYRNVMLRLETPIAYSYGTLIYTLKSATFSA